MKKQQVSNTKGTAHRIGSRRSFHVLITLTFILFLNIYGQEAFAQGVGISETTITPDANAILELRSTLRGFLAPRMTTAQRITLGLIPPSEGMLVYDTDTQSFWYYSSGWKAIVAGILVGDVTGTAGANTVQKINGTSLAGLGTGILKNTTGTGVPSIAIAGDFPILNQNTTGNAATVTTNANLTGPIISIGNATSVASQTGTGSTFVMATSPALVTPDLGTPTALVGTNITGTAAGLTAGTVTTNANLTGPVTSVGNATAIANGAITNAMLANAAVANLSGTNTGDQTNITGNAGTATKLAATKNINGVPFDGSADITVTAIADASTLTGTTLASNVVNSSLTSVGTLGNLTVTNPIAGSITGNAATATTATTATTAGTVTTAAQPAITSVGTLTGLTVTAPIAGSITGNAATVTTNANLTGPVTSVGNATAIANGAITNAMLANTAVANLSGTNTGDQTNITGNAGTATKLAAPKKINGVNFDGSADITVTAVADAGTLTGTTLASNVVNSSLTSVGTLGNLTVTNPIAGSITGNAATATTATTAGTVTTAAQPAITSVGTLTGLTVTAPIVGSVTGNAGTATALATPRTIAGTSFDGSANISLANKFIVQGTTDSGLTGAQFLGSLGTGIVKNTTTTGVLSIASPGTDYAAGVANPVATIGLTSVNGTATTAMRSDGAPALSQAIIPTWTGLHTFTGGLTSTGATINLNASTANATNIGNGTNNLIQLGTIDINQSGTANTRMGNTTGTLTIEGGTTATAIQIGNGGTPHGIQIGTGAAANALVIGSSNTTSTTLIQGGNGAGAISLDPNTGGIITIGDPAGTGAITVGSSSAAQTVNIGTGTGVSTVNVGNTAANSVVKVKSPLLRTIGIAITSNNVGQTLSGANMANGCVFQLTGTTNVNFTLDTGTALSAALPGVSVGDMISFVVCNSSTRTITMVGGTGTTLPSAITIATHQSRTFYAINTGANAWTIY